MWVNRQNTPQASACLMSDGTNCLKLEQFNTAHLVGVTRLGVVDNSFSPAYSVPIGAWTHLAFVGTSSGVTLYANGVQKGTVTNVQPCPLIYLGTTWKPSSNLFTDFMLGSMDELMTFNRALSQAEINSIFSAGAGGAVKAPQVTSTMLDTNGHFVMNLEGRIGKNYTLYFSHDLLTWNQFTTLSNTNGTNSFTVMNGPGSTKAFYRISQPY
jgi:hypothetical protein